MMGGTVLIHASLSFVSQSYIFNAAVSSSNKMGINTLCQLTLGTTLNRSLTLGNSSIACPTAGATAVRTIPNPSGLSKLGFRYRLAAFLGSSVRTGGLSNLAVWWASSGAS